MVALSEKLHHSPAGFSQVVREIVNGAVTRRYTLGHWIISETQNISGTWTTSFYGYDGHNSVRFLTNAAGAVTDNYTFDAFGIKIASVGSTPNQILYSGEYLDLGTGNYDLRARVYNENTGTFLTRDTYAGQNGDPITLHQYLYAGADPVMNVDPSGNISIASVTISIGIMSTLGGTVGGPISAVTGGSFWEGFWKGFISTGVSTTLFTLTPLKNLYVDGAVGTTVANLVVDYFDGKLEAQPQLAAAEIGTSVLLSLVGGAIYSQALPGLSTNLANIAVVVENNFPSGSFGTLAEELGPAVVKSSFLGGISVIPSQLVDAAYHAYEWFVQQSQQRQQEIDQAIKNAGG